MRVEVDYERLYFAYRVGDESREWIWLSQQFDASILSDEATRPGLPNFTGAFVGMACQDMSGARCPADFDYFSTGNKAIERILSLISEFQLLIAKQS
jgi:xylan 1,4-beta-xylosidase